MPCLMLNYFGQGAFVMTNPDAITSPFYSMAPSWALIPLIILATFATVIASQAVISGAFSMTKQAIALGYMPRLSVIYTSDKEAGQIYVPFINIILFIAVVLLVITFKNSHSLASAYGIAVTMTMLIDTILVFFVMKYHWKWSNYKSYLFLIVFAAIDIAFLASNSLKIMAGGWFPLLLGGTVFFLMTTWKTGRDLVRHSLKENSLDLYTFMPHLVDGGIFRVQGTAIFLNSIYGKTPVSFMHNLKHNKVLHETVIFFTMQAQPVPYAQEENRIVAKELAQGVWQVTVQLGFKELPDVPQILNALAQKQFIPNWEYEPMDTSFFLSRETVLSTPGEGMAQWRERLFGWMSQNATRAALYFNIPPNRVVELGAQVCI